MLELIHGDCMEYMRQMKPNSIDYIFTDIPYTFVSRESNGLRNLDKDKADIITFDVHEFCELCYKVCSGTIIIFCGKHQVSGIFDYFEGIQRTKGGTCRQLIYEKTNPSPMNGQYIYLSGIENAIWFKNRGGRVQCSL